jgi:hypothetical protein
MGRDDYRNQAEGFKLNNQEASSRKLDMLAARLLLPTITLGLLLPGLSSGSTFERTKVFETSRRVQASWVYRLVYIVDERGHLVLIRQDGVVISGPQSANRQFKRK